MLAASVVRPAVRTAVLVLLVMAAMPLLQSHAQALGVFEGHTDVGDVGQAGEASYDPATGVYTVAGSGADMWYGEDAFHVVYTRMTGDFVLRARAELLGEGGDPHRKMGWIIRTGLGPSDAYVSAAVHGDGLASLQYRPAAGEDTREARASVTAPDVVQLARENGVYTMYAARFGDPFETVELGGVELGDEVYVGLFVSAHDNDAVERARFRDVRIVRPAPADLVAYQEYLGSHLEILDTATGAREIVHTTPGSIQAPNWTPDDAALIYNGDGRLYRFDLATRTPSVIDTDFATRNNNDHVLSFDGRTLGISHHAEEHDGQSIVYTMPVEGGTPRKVTDEGPSYLHGFSPDGRYVVYTAERGDGEYDLYRKPVDGGPEERLTDAPGLDDGSEYSPDGAWIYFNSARTGTMQLWRMRPDGTGAEQLTHDELNDWFPHVSPDGRQVLFLSYGTDVAAGDHPFYKHVYLRLMPAEGGTPRVVAYLYGGQGTINVPSWAPDSRRAAFVSNSGPVVGQE